MSSRNKVILNMTNCSNIYNYMGNSHLELQLVSVHKKMYPINFTLVVDDFGLKY